MSAKEKDKVSRYENTRGRRSVVGEYHQMLFLNTRTSLGASHGTRNCSQKSQKDTHQGAASAVNARNLHRFKGSK